MQKFKPIHEKIREYLFSEIKAGSYNGIPLPTEKELAEKFQTSVGPVRQALERLKLEGVIYRHPGRGTFVSRAVDDDTAWTLESIQDIIGIEVGTTFQLQEFSNIQIPEDMKKVFGPREEKLFRIKGIRFAKETPFLVLTAYLPQYIGEQFQGENFASMPIIVAIGKKLGIKVMKCVQITSAALADTEISNLLQIPPGNPTLCIERTYYTETEAAIEFARSYYRHDLFKHRSILLKL